MRLVIPLSEVNCNSLCMTKFHIVPFAQDNPYMYLLKSYDMVTVNVHTCMFECMCTDRHTGRYVIDNVCLKLNT